MHCSCYNPRCPYCGQKISPWRTEPFPYPWYPWYRNRPPYIFEKTVIRKIGRPDTIITIGSAIQKGHQALKN